MYTLNCILVPNLHGSVESHVVRKLFMDNNILGSIPYSVNKSGIVTRAAELEGLVEAKASP